jgi:AAA domain, putative AbiEii toxin, Type IV TA system/AAA domain
MHIKHISIKGYRRFNDLTIGGLSENARLVIVAGPNGNGKSSLFDAFNSWHRSEGQFDRSLDASYHHKAGAEQIGMATDQRIKIEFFEPIVGDHTERRKIFNIRTAYRNDADFAVDSLTRMQPAVDQLRFTRLIDNDVAVHQNYMRIVSNSVDDLFSPDKSQTKFGEYVESKIGTLNSALGKMFPQLRLNGVGKPLEKGTFLFRKGTSDNFSYKNLSGGEKAAFDLVLDISVKSVEFNNSVYCIDEPETHLNPRIHAALLDAMLELIPSGSQLWLATHSIGMMRRAMQMHRLEGAQVNFLDFEQEFDSEQILRPTVPDRRFWARSLAVALDDLASLVAPNLVVFCEGGISGKETQKANDAEIYDRIFSQSHPEVRFVSLGSATQMTGVADRFLAASTTLGVIEGTKYIRLLDRDDRSAVEIERLKTEQNVRVLNQRHIESYLFSNEILSKLANIVGRADLAEAVISSKEEAVVKSEARQNPSDDIKSASGEIYTSCKRILSLTQVGSTKQAFMRDTLAPLITYDTETYKQLHGVIFG